MDRNTFVVLLIIPVLLIWKHENEYTVDIIVESLQMDEIVRKSKMTVTYLDHKECYAQQFKLASW